eukprot:CAMPEP_0178458842 /NCGR_PEP_ID=MMETSP0689_2-20121128/47768_1 /TAXON_ID=160604 /ORGANISM="Amphidinium massartii, Strain CS-259" /LENGTH=137 /DNA_ID=CAMNT_0020085191 /DNA_START=198 /DNA_END=612 /DNA_ORIENTATION=+
MATARPRDVIPFSSSCSIWSRSFPPKKRSVTTVKLERSSKVLTCLQVSVMSKSKTTTPGVPDLAVLLDCADTSADLDAASASPRGCKLAADGCAAGMPGGMGKQGAAKPQASGYADCSTMSATSGFAAQGSPPGSAV